MTAPLLAHTPVTAGEPTRWALMLHGILGRGSNWRAIARGITRARPEWGVLLVDLRQHGGSCGFEGPHTVESAARDLEALSDVVDGPIEAVYGHSFGGKVALAYAEHGQPDLHRVTTFDSSPGRVERVERGGRSTDGVVSMLEGLPPRYPSRQAFVDRVVAEGQTQVLAQWLAMNVERSDDGDYLLTLDVPSVRDLIEDYYVRDYWHVVEGARPGLEVDLVVSGRSTVYTDAEVQRARDAADDVLVLPEASHWLHVDSKDALLRHVLERI